jgi:hypothetical protein
MPLCDHSFIAFPLSMKDASAIRNTSLLKYLLTIIDAEVCELEVLSRLGSSEFETVHTCYTPPDLTSATRKSHRKGKRGCLNLSIVKSMFQADHLLQKYLLRMLFADVASLTWGGKIRASFTSAYFLRWLYMNKEHGSFPSQKSLNPSFA